MRPTPSHTTDSHAVNLYRIPRFGFNTGASSISTAARFLNIVSTPLLRTISSTKSFIFVTSVESSSRLCVRRPTCGFGLRSCMVRSSVVDSNESRPVTASSLTTYHAGVASLMSPLGWISACGGSQPYKTPPLASLRASCMASDRIGGRYTARRINDCTQMKT
jgi:hypothetical protein